MGIVSDARAEWRAMTTEEKVIEVCAAIMFVICMATVVVAISFVAVEGR